MREKAFEQKSPSRALPKTGFSGISLHTAFQGKNLDSNGDNKQKHQKPGCSTHPLHGVQHRRVREKAGANHHECISQTQRGEISGGGRFCSQRNHAAHTRPDAAAQHTA